MGVPSIRDVVIVPFPFSDLSQTKVRPAVCLADANLGDWILCQITSNPYGDPTALSISAADFEAGGLQSHSFARPAKLFTAHQGAIIRTVGKLKQNSFQRLVDAVVAVIRP
jgi:mRNA interferase MazF